MKEQNEIEKETLKRKTEEMINNQTKEIKEIENLTEMIFKEIVFDSAVCNWTENTSTFDNHIFGKEKLVFVIEDTDNNLFGGYINSKINSYLYQDENKQWKGNNIYDEKSFTFSLKSNRRSQKPIKFIIKSNKKQMAFGLYKNNDWNLFNLGGDIFIRKKNHCNQCICYANAYRYNEQRNILTGKIGKENPFTVKRIQVYQMSETPKQKEIETIPILVPIN